MWLQVENQKYQDDLNVYINGVYKNVHLFECMLSWMRGENKYVGSSQHRSWQTGREGGWRLLYPVLQPKNRWK